VPHPFRVFCERVGDGNLVLLFRIQNKDDFLSPKSDIWLTLPAFPPFAVSDKSSPQHVHMRQSSPPEEETNLIYALKACSKG